MSVSFDKKLAELDAYLQMLIIENESLDKKINALSSSSLSLQNIALHDNEREGLSNIKNNLEKLLSSIKHSIVLLQIAKVSSKATSSSECFEPRPIPSPPTRPTRSSKLINSGSSRGSGSHSGSSQEYSSDSFGNNNNNNKRVKSNSSKYNLSSETSASCYAPPQHTQQLEVDDSAAANLELRRDSFSQDQPPLKLSSSSGSTRDARAETARTEIKISNGSKNVAVNLNRFDGHVNNYAGAGNVDEEDEDAFFDAADEQQLSNINKSVPVKIDIADKNTSISEYPTPNLKSADDNTQDTVILSTTLNESLQLSHSNQTASPAMPPNQQSSSIITNETNKNNNDSPIEDGSIDWDALYEEDEDELGSLEGQGSVIKHLLSQIRIGMDLTKVVLPTFILERRSLLEMYADFFAHPDLFSAIPDFETPEERMIQLVRWYLSAFHAGRRSSVAKKPYNPILGEIFRCEWSLAASENSQLVSRDNNDDNTSHNDQRQQQPQQQKLTFVAEQVSHHPPVSAFYAENKEKHISCCAHIYTKSKYLGLSVGVHNIGQGVISLSRHNETYVCTFPSAYGRSILTMPWVELGGSVNISCEQTGYKANIEFITKPFYGGKKHRVTGEIFRPNNEPILAIDGEWNGIMYSKAPPNSSEKKIFVDTTNLPLIKKHVDSINSQETFESRNVWKEVTRALKIRDVNSATAAKSFIEQRQRDLLKERLEQGIEWKTRFFENCDDGWKFSPN